MALLTIGEFARLSRLSPKALRLYDELGLLRPRQVDPLTGYRRYAPEQLEEARLVAWLRRLGMPLARIRRIRELDGPATAREVAAFLADAVARANRAVRDLVDLDPDPDPGANAGAEVDPAGASRAVGTTLTALLWTGSALALVHIGDSRAYLLRGGELRQITHDHTFVRSMVEDGRLRPEEAATHPQRLLLLRALDGGAATFPDIGLREVRRGDRYLLCSDGLSGAVPAAELHRVLVTTTEPEQAVRALVALANGSGGADNVTCVVADVVPAVT
ncbi:MULTISPECIES: MerR family transcriptional regulator [Frankia]|uniref:Transcriptional regulator (MerR-family) n=1 Tax=Frankia alni (strain DSM 45986 / CECT 9034 / ACN14a) TaxID=326424 RepID=Q0RD04_FRAAA|nr:transcriptional regulator (MerR-family) [Frankia alni ACN14a]